MVSAQRGGSGASLTISHGNAAPANLYSASQLTDVSAFTRSEVAEKIRRSFDALVKASPIGVPLVGIDTINWKFFYKGGACQASMLSSLTHPTFIDAGRAAFNKPPPWCPAV